MTAPRPSGARPSRKANRETAPSMADLCPDEARVLAEIRAAGGSIKPSKLRAMYRRITANADAEHDHGSGPTYTDRRRRASLPADLAVGERVAARMAGGAST